MDRTQRLRDRLRTVLDEAAAGDNPLDALSDLETLELFVDDYTRARIADARAAGASWSEIATRLGVSRQAAHKRFRSKGQGKAVIELRLIRDKKKR